MKGGPTPTKKRLNVPELCLLVLAFLLTIATIVIFYLNATRDWSISSRLLPSALGMLMTLLLLLFCHHDSSSKEPSRLLFSLMVFLILCNFFLFFCSSLLDGTPETRLWQTIIHTLNALITCAANVLFSYYLCYTLTSHRHQKLFLGLTWIIHILLAAFLIVNFLTGCYFIIDESYHLQYTNLIFPRILLGVHHLSYLLFVFLSKGNLKKKWTLSSYVFFPLLQNALSFLWEKCGGPAVPIASDYFFSLMTLYVVFFNVVLQDQQDLLYQRLSNAEKSHDLAEQEKQQLEWKTAIMLSQIQPHFLYNALTAIYALCRSNPEEAAKTTAEFADYLRMNMSSLQSRRLVPFHEELAHTRTYLHIEKLRFADKLHIQYDIRYEDFLLPPLTLQPLVENAVKHGAGQLENGGTVTIRVRYDRSDVVISVIDTGPGFDPNSIANDDNVHVGIANVRSRLEALANGELHIDSAPGHPTVATIILHQPHI